MVPCTSALFGYLLEDLFGSKEAGLDFLRSPDSDYFPGASAQDVAKLRLCRSLFKKLNDEVAVDADKRCLDKFHESNLLARGWRLEPQNLKEEELVGEFQYSIDRFFYSFGEPLVGSYMDLMVRGRPGPGASLCANGEDFYTKHFSSRLSATSPELYSLYNEYCCWYPNWVEAELARYFNFGPPQITLGNSLSFVRKTRDISRSICTEPSLNLWLQLGLGEIIGDRLKSAFGIDLKTQPDRNRRLAFVGSVNGSVATIDLESASDSMSLGMCSTFLPEYLFDILMQIRSPRSKIGADWVTLYMVSTMGNGSTFPLQTAIFACVVDAVARWHRCHLNIDENWGVFGDDIICPTELSVDVCRLLTLLGFRVNASKSYFVGPFRESCGADFYSGVNVRGVYLKSLVTQESRFVAINLLNEWSARHGLPIPRTIGYLVDSVRALAVPAHAPPDSGIRLPRPPIGLWHSKRQRYLYRRREVVTPYLDVDVERGTFRYHGPKKRTRKRIWNLNGLQIAFVGGFVRNMRISLPLKQGETPSYRTCCRVSPFWGPDGEQLRLAPDAGFWTRWAEVVPQNVEQSSLERGLTGV